MHRVLMTLRSAANEVVESRRLQLPMSRLAVPLAFAFIGNSNFQVVCRHEQSLVGSFVVITS